MYPVAITGLGVVLPPGLEGGPDYDRVSEVMSWLRDRLGLPGPVPEVEDDEDEDDEDEDGPEWAFKDEGDWPGLPVRMERYGDNICAYPTEGGWVAFITRSVTRVGFGALPLEPHTLSFTPTQYELDALFMVLARFTQQAVAPGPLLVALLEE